LPGDTFGEVVDTSRAIVDVAIDADDSRAYGQYKLGDGTERPPPMGRVASRDWL